MPEQIITVSRRLRVQSELVINYGFSVTFFAPKPNWWWRLWQWLLLGWRWEDVDA